LIPTCPDLLLKNKNSGIMTIKPRLKERNLLTKPMIFTLGYQQALADFDHGRVFHDYSETRISFGNIVSGNRIREIADFIRGYNSAKYEAIEKTK
jgi:hypothetical protein